MLCNFHTHSTFCDGKDTIEQMILTAIEKNFKAIGFSGHSFTPCDTSYCMKDTEGYISQVCALREKYGDQIQIYLGIEEDSSSLIDRNRFDYIIGSCHYININGTYYSLDGEASYIQRCIDAYDGNRLGFAEAYFQGYCDYIKSRKPDIIAHFDLITKFDESHDPFFLGDPQYEKIAEKYITIAAESDCIFEVNTGAISRGYRTSPYPSEQLMHVLKKLDAKLILSSDAHSAEALDCHFSETKAFLHDVGFRSLYTLDHGQFTKIPLYL